MTRSFPAIERLIHAYLELRDSADELYRAYRRLGMEPFKAALYPPANDGNSAHAA